MAYELIEKIKNKEISILDLTESCFERIEETDHLLHSFVNLSKEKAIKKAKLLDDNLKKGKKIGELHGLPLANKDLICVKDFPTTCASRILQGFRPPYDAYVIKSAYGYRWMS